MIPRIKYALVSLVLLFAVLSGTAAGAAEVDEALFKRIEGNLMCTDGCGMYLPACDNQTAENMRAQIKEKMVAGISEKEIYAFMISIYGEEVMAAPPPDRTFNLLAWVLPFLGILAGGLVIYLALDRWVFNRRSLAVASDPGVDEAELAAYQDILDEEIKKHL